MSISLVSLSLPNRSKMDDEFAFLEAIIVSDIDVIINAMAKTQVILVCVNNFIESGWVN